MPRIRKGWNTFSGTGAEATGTCLTKGSVRETYAANSASYMASHGRGASSGAYSRSTTRSASLRSCAIARLERYRPANAGLPNKTANSSWPTMRRGVSVPEMIFRVEAADASRACCQASCIWSNDSQSTVAEEEASPTGDCTTWISYCPGTVLRLTASSITLNFLSPSPAMYQRRMAVERHMAVEWRMFSCTTNVVMSRPHAALCTFSVQAAPSGI